MSQPPLLLRRVFYKRRPYICWRCQQARRISTNHLRKVDEGEQRWREKAERIRNGEEKSMLQVLEERGFLHSIAGERKELDRLLTDKRVGVYCGVDPTAQSLHVGHLLPMMALFWMFIHGFRGVALIGGSTAKFGDPTGRTTSREQLTTTERKANVVAMHYQMKKMWLNVEGLAKKHGHEKDRHWYRALVNNGTWWCCDIFTDILKYMGTGFRMGTMLSRDTVKTKMSSPQGMSFAEFCYPVMQAWDWWRLYNTRQVQVQIGGADQFGNICTGIDAVKHISATHPDSDVRLEDPGSTLTSPFGFTVPLLTTASGEKFGKSAGNAVWLDRNLTSLFDLYRFLVGTADQDVERYLKLFTFIKTPEILALMAEHNKDPPKRLAQHTLAREFIHLAHGVEGVRDAEAQHNKFMLASKHPNLSNLLSGSQSPPSEDSGPENAPEAKKSKKDMNDIKNFVTHRVNKHAPPNNRNAPTAMQQLVLPKSLIWMQPVAKVFYSAGLVTSRSEGHRLCQNQGGYIGRLPSDRQTMGDALSFYPAKLQDPHRTWNNVIRDRERDSRSPMDKDGEEGILILRAGKWNVRIIRIVSDEKFKTLGLPDPPGWRELSSQKAAGKALQEQQEHPLPWHPDRPRDDADAGDFVEPTARINRRELEANRRAGRASAVDVLERRAAQGDPFERPQPTNEESMRSSSPSRPERARPASSSSHDNSTPFPWERELSKSATGPRRPRYPDPQTQTHLPKQTRHSLVNPAYRASLSPEELKQVRREKNAWVMRGRAEANQKILQEQREDQADRRRAELKKGLSRLHDFMDKKRVDRGERRGDGAW